MRSPSAIAAILSILLVFPCGTISAADTFCGYTAKATVTVVTKGGKSLSFRAGIADTVPLHRKGLMDCPALPKGHALLFVFGDLTDRSFWMYHTVMPLTIVYVGEDLRVVSVREGEPRSTLSLPSGRPARYVLEVNRAEGTGIAPGDVVRISFD